MAGYVGHPRTCVCPALCWRSTGRTGRLGCRESVMRLRAWSQQPARRIVRSHAKPQPRRVSPFSSRTQRTRSSMSPIVKTPFWLFWTSTRVAGSVRFIRRSRIVVIIGLVSHPGVPALVGAASTPFCVAGSPDRSRLSAQRHLADSRLASRWGQPWRTTCESLSLLQGGPERFTSVRSRGRTCVENVTHEREQTR